MKTIANEPPTPDATGTAPREPMPEESVIAERQLPTLKELLPSATWSSSSSRDSGPVSLNTKDPIYVSYFNKIKQLHRVPMGIPGSWPCATACKAGSRWNLPLASNGQLERLRIIRSSGSQVLDDEALRAIKAAAPFPPIPPWIKPNPLFDLGVDGVPR